MKTAVPHRTVWWGIILWIVLTCLLLGGAADLAYWNHLFAVESQPVEGKVVGKTYQVSHGKGGPNYTYVLTYIYQTKDLQVQCQRSVRLATWNQVNPGDGIHLKILADQPKVSRIDYYLEDRVYESNAVTLLGLGLLTLVLGAGWFTYAIRKNKLRERLLSRGVPSTGRVTSLQTVNVGKGQMRTYLVFGFTDNRGQEVVGKTWYLAPATSPIGTSEKASRSTITRRIPTSSPWIWAPRLNRTSSDAGDGWHPNSRRAET